MYRSQLITFLILMVFKPTYTSQEKYNPLNGKHLRVIAYEFGKTLFCKRNSTNHIVEINGVLIHYIEAITKMFNFSYSFVPEITLPIEDAVTFVGKSRADYMLGAALGTVSRFKVADFTASWSEGPYYCVVPYPKKEYNAVASLEPLSFQVWILIFASALTTILSLHLLVNNRLIIWQSTIALKPTSAVNDIVGGINSFVWGNLVSQGQRFSSSRLVVRFVAGSWCVGCFFLVQSYCSIVTSHLTSPNQKPIVNSIQELAHSTKVSITVERDLGLKSIIMNAEIGNLRLLGDKLRRNSSLISNSTSDCLETVKNDGSIAYCNSLNNLNAIMEQDFKKTGTCQYLLIHNVLASYFAHTLLPKNSPYTETISRGTLRIKESGLYNEWFTWYIPSPRQCKSNIKSPDKSLKKLSLGNLISAFMLLLCGLLVSVVIYVLETVSRTLCNR